MIRDVSWFSCRFLLVEWVCRALVFGQLGGSTSESWRVMGWIRLTGDGFMCLSPIRPPGVWPEGGTGQLHSQGHWGLSMKPFPLPAGETNFKWHYLYLTAQFWGVAFFHAKERTQRWSKFTAGSTDIDKNTQQEISCICLSHALLGPI